MQLLKHPDKNIILSEPLIRILKSDNLHFQHDNCFKICYSIFIKINLLERNLIEYSGKLKGIMVFYLETKA